MTIKIENALVKGADSYHWRTYTGSKAMSLTSKHGIKVKLEMGDRFGKRMSADGKKIRAIFEELGPTKVFTIDLATSVKLDKNSKQVKAR